MNTKIKKVHVIYKTHLDIGFTDFAQNVLDRYTNEYIPNAVNLAFKLNTPENKKFIWTVGSFLIDYYLKNASKDAIKNFEKAIKLGYITWHGISCTTHTELMDKELFKYSLNISKELDKKYNKTTIASKMTDVPGHTISIVPYMAEAGLKYMHIGVNGSSMVPMVPEMFLWKINGAELIVHYASDYGASFSIDGLDEVLEFAHTGDNLGPQSEEDVEKEFNRIKAKYPNAKVEASTLDEFAKAVIKIKDKLPVIEEEIGDTWIHGVASDPVKVVQFKTLLTLKNKWLKEGLLKEGSYEYTELMTNLMLITEHTWGLDYKKYLADFKNWTKEDFLKARKADITTLESLTIRNIQIYECLKDDIAKYRNGEFKGSYKEYEKSHEEQREYILKAIEKLPRELKEEAKLALNNIIPLKKSIEGNLIKIGDLIEINGWKVKFNGEGAINHLECMDKKWIKSGELGKLQYEVFDAKICSDNYYKYNRNFYETMWWSEPDFSKPGLEFVDGLENICYNFSVTSIIKEKNNIYVSIKSDDEAASKYSSPRIAEITYNFDKDVIRCNLQWFDKDPGKIPEAIWFKMKFDVENPNRFMMKKIDQLISPLNVLKGGNRNQHCVEALYYHGADGVIEIKNIHSPLVSVGGRNLYKMDHKFNNLENGFYFNLFNNRWGTNFKMWCEDNCYFDFEIRIKTN